MTIYLDAIWILNFLLDLMLLLLTGTLAKEITSRMRLLLGAFVASLIVPLTIYYSDTFLTGFSGKFVYSVIIILFTFRFYSIHRTLKLLLLFYFVTFTVGGGLFALHYMLEQPLSMSTAGFVTVNQGYGDPVSWLFILFGFPCVWLFAKRRMDKHAIEKIRYDQLYKVTITMNNESYTTNGFIDSGNQLVCPMTKKPVVICDEIFLNQWFTEQEWKQLKEAQENMQFEKIPRTWESNIHIVPYQGVGGKSQFLLALRPKELIIDYDMKKIKTDNVLIGIQFASLTKDHMYHCLLQPQLIKLSAVETA